MQRENMLGCIDRNALIFHGNGPFMIVLEQPHYGTVDAVGRSTPTIEQAFAILKRQKAFSGKSLDKLITSRS